MQSLTSKWPRRALGEKSKEQKKTGKIGAWCFEVGNWFNTRGKEYEKPTSKMDPEAFLDLANQVTKLKMFPYFDIAHSVLCALAVREDLGPGK